MRTKNRLIWAALPLAIAFALAWPPTSLAESEMKDVVVTATLSEHEARTAPASVSVVAREELKARNPVDLLDAVRGEPGITLTGRSVGGRKTMAMRGLEGKHVLNLIDGRRISASDDVVGHSDYQYGWLPMSAIDRIEVLRGPMSTLYGSEALGGVVNLVTRKPKDRWIGSVGVTGADLLEGDGGGRADASVFAAGPVVGGIDLRLTGQTQRIAAVPLKEDTRYSELEGRKAQTGGIAAGWDYATGQRVELGWLDGQEDRWRGNVSGTKAYEDRYDLKRSHGHATWSGKFSGWHAQAGLYRSELDIVNSRTNGVTPTRPQNLRDDVFEAHAATELSGNLLTIGGERRIETLKNSGLAGGEDDATHTALFVQDEVPLTTSVLLTAGVRADDHEYFGTEYSPRAYLVWEATPELVVKGGYGHAFKAPTLKQISPSYVGAEGPHTFYGNADVEPEKSDSMEIGADWQSGGLNVRGVLFHSRIDDLITTRLLTVSGSRRTYQYANVNRAEVTGLETGFTWALYSDLSWNTDLTLLKTKDRDAGVELSGRPKQSLTSRLDWQAGDGWGARAGFEHIGRQLDSTGEHVPRYTLWNASVAKQFGKLLTMRVGVDNLTDVRLAEESAAFGYAERGRTAYASVRADF